MKKNCRMCKHDKFDLVIDFGENPLVNSLIDKEDLDKPEITAPLKVKKCKGCGLVQIVNNVDAEKIYKDVDYLFFSSDMPTLSEYFKEYADDIKSRLLPENSFVVEIGSNDGVLLKHFNEHTVLGVDPATNVAIRALKNNIPTLPLFWSERLAGLILKEYGKANMICGNNCIAHLDDLHDLMRGVTLLLADDGVFIVECNYWGGMVKNLNYALIYHDHFSYFSVKNWIQFSEKFGMRVFDAVVTEAQGGSLRMFMCKDSRPETPRLKGLIEEEEQTELNSLKVAKEYRGGVMEKAEHLNKLISDLKAEGKKIAGYGAAAKGFSILKLAGIDQRHIDYFVDDSPAKQNKFTPISHIPIYSRESVNDNLPDYFFITAPNYAKVIINKEQEFLANGGKFILEDGEIIG